MNRTGLLVVCLAAVVATSVPAQWRSQETNPPVARAMEVMNELQQATRSMNAEHVASLYFEDALRVFSFPTGGRHVVEGRGAILEQQAAEFRQIRREDPAALRRFTLPEPEIVHIPDHLPILVFRTDDAASFQYFQFDERDGRLAISRQIEIIRELEPIEAVEGFEFADENSDGILEPIEQNLLMDQYLSMAGGPHPSRRLLDRWFDWNGDSAVDEVESARAVTILYRDGLRQGYRFFAEFAHTYVDFDGSGAVSIPEADLAVNAAFDREREVPRPVEDPMDERIDLDLDGWVIAEEIEAYVFALTRAVASIPGLPLTNPGTPGEGPFVVWWADADESGWLEDQEISDVGTILMRIVMGTEVVSNPIEIRFDRDNDYLLSPGEREAATEEILGRLPDEEQELILGAVLDPARLIGRRPLNWMQHEIDSDPEDGRIAEHEVFMYLERRFAEIAGRWIAEAPDLDTQVAQVDVPEEGKPADKTEQIDDTAPTDDMPGQPPQVSTPSIAATRTVTADQVGDEVSIAVSLNPVYPVLRIYYDTAPLGTATITNTSSADLSDIEVTLSLSKYIDQPRTYETIETLAASESKTVDLTLLFNSSVLDITEGDRVDATVTVEYEGAAGEDRETATESMVFYNRNAIRWDDTRRVAAFVTARDDEVRSFARRAIASTRDSRNSAVDDSLQDAMVLFNAMVESDLMYFSDPSSSYASASSSGTTIDYLQFPRRTITDYGGDCDDLSVCYNALLESVGRRTAFVTVPGHIFPAVALDMSADDARSAFMDPTDLIFDGDDVWVPVEITALDKSFYEAWQFGAKTYRQYSGSGQAELISTSDAWAVYEPVASVSDEDIDDPDHEAIDSAFAEDLSEFVNTQIAGRELELEANLVERPGDRRLLNQLGVLYAQYGLWEKARTQFETIVASQEYVPALLNLGHIEFLDGNYRDASQYYDRVLTVQPSHPGGLLAAARANHELENYGNVRTYYQELRELSPRLASDHSYLDLTSSNEAARAQAASEARSKVSWELEAAEEAASE